ncbi:TPA: Ig-like domain-containing protein [Photobacterium damselae]
MKDKFFFVLSRLVLVACFLLSACGGGDDSSPPSNDDKYVTAVIADSYAVFPLSEKGVYRVNLINNVTLTKQEKIKVDSVSSLGKRHDCEIIDRDNDGFTIKADNPTVCDYQYTVALDNKEHILGGDKEGVSRILISRTPDNAKLTPFGIVTFSGKETIIDLSAELSNVGDSTSLNDYDIDEDVIITPSDSTSTVSVDNLNKTIHYTSDANFTGNERLSYSLKNAAGDVIAGSIFITVTEDSSNSSISIEDKIDYKPVVDVNSEVTIDVSPYVTNSDDDYQIVEINTFDAIIKLSDPTSFQNKSFTFLASQAGQYYVNVVVSDHRGGYDVALIRITVSDPSVKTWSDIVDGSLIFSAPLTNHEANLLGLIHAPHYDNGVNANVATFDVVAGTNYCTHIGQRVPDLFELEALYKNQKPKDKGWPVEVPYMTQGFMDVINLDDGAVSKVDISSSYYLTCVKKLNATSKFEIDRVNSDVVDKIANGTDTASIIVKVSAADDGSPMSGESVTLSLNSVTANPNSYNLTTGSDGQATFTLTDTVAEAFEAKVVHDGEERVINVSFIADSSVGTLRQVTTKTDADPDDSASYAEVKAILRDSSGNPLVGKDINFINIDGKVAKVRIDKVTPKTDGAGELYAKIYWDDTFKPTTDTVLTIKSSFMLPDSTHTYGQSPVTFKGVTAPPPTPSYKFQTSSYTVEAGIEDFFSNLLFLEGTSTLAGITPASCEVEVLTGTVAVSRLEPIKNGCFFQTSKTAPSGSVTLVTAKDGKDNDLDIFAIQVKGSTGPADYEWEPKSAEALVNQSVTFKLKNRTTGTYVRPDKCVYTNTNLGSGLSVSDFDVKVVDNGCQVSGRKEGASGDGQGVFYPVVNGTKLETETFILVIKSTTPPPSAVEAHFRFGVVNASVAFPTYNELFLDSNNALYTPHACVSSSSAVTALVDSRGGCKVIVNRTGVSATVSAKDPSDKVIDSFQVLVPVLIDRDYDGVIDGKDLHPDIHDSLTATRAFGTLDYWLSLLYIKPDWLAYRYMLTSDRKTYIKNASPLGTGVCPGDRYFNMTFDDSGQKGWCLSLGGMYPYNLQTQYVDILPPDMRDEIQKVAAAASLIDYNEENPKHPLKIPKMYSQYVKNLREARAKDVLMKYIH